jgi:hypothetical protein
VGKPWAFTTCLTLLGVAVAVASVPLSSEEGKGIQQSPFACCLGKAGGARTMPSVVISGLQGQLLPTTAELSRRLRASEMGQVGDGPAAAPLHPSAHTALCLEHCQTCCVSSGQTSYQKYL